MFDISQIAGNVFAKAAKVVLRESRDAIALGRRILARIKGLPIRVVGRLITALEKAIATLSKIVSKLEKLVKKIAKGEIRVVRQVAGLADDLADIMGKVLNMVDRVASFVETKFINAFHKMRSAVSKSAAQIFALTKKAIRGVAALKSQLQAALNAAWSSEFASDLKEAITILVPIDPILRALQSFRAMASKAIDAIDADKMLAGVKKFVEKLMDKVANTARLMAQAIRLRSIAVRLRTIVVRMVKGAKKIVDRTTSTAVRALTVVFEKVVGELESMADTAMDVLNEAMGLRGKVLAEAKVLEAQARKARDQARVRQQILKKLAH